MASEQDSGAGSDPSLASESSFPDADVARPLADVRVLDLSRYLPGPLVSRLLADLGADVVKVEEPTLGDPSRQAPPQLDGRSSLAAILLAGHRSLALDLKKEPARQVLLELLADVDVLVESFRPGVLAGWGLAPEKLQARFPALVLCSVTGWGQDGPLARRSGHDLTYQALAGTLAPRPEVVPASQTADILGAWSAVSAILAALYRRQRTGRGCWIDQSLADAAGHAAITNWAAEADGPKALGKKLPLTGALPCYDLYSTKDGGYLAVAALEPKFWRRFCRALGRLDLVARQFSTEDATRNEVARVVKERSRDEWAEFLTELDVPVEPVLSASEALEHPQVKSRGMFFEAEDGLRRLAFPARFDGQRPCGDPTFPEHGQHTHDLLRGLEAPRGLGRWARRRGGIGRRFRLKARLLQWATGLLSRRIG